MELKLNVYDGRAVIKTYSARDFTLKTGVCEDILKFVDIDKFNGGLNDETMLLEVVKIVIKAFSKFKPLMQEIFDGLTDEEYENTSIKEVAQVVVQVITYTITELFTITNSKN